MKAPADRLTSTLLRPLGRSGIGWFLFVGALATIVLGRFEDSSPLEFELIRPVIQDPAWSIAALVELVLPLAITVLVVQNGQGFAVLENVGHRAPVKAVTLGCGIWTMLTAMIGTVCTCLTGPTNALIASSGERSRHYTAGIFVGVLSLGCSGDMSGVVMGRCRASLNPRLSWPWPREVYGAQRSAHSHVHWVSDACTPGPGTSGKPSACAAARSATKGSRRSSACAPFCLLSFSPLGPSTSGVCKYRGVGRPSACCSKIWRAVFSHRSCPRTTSLTPCAASSTTTASW